MAHLHFKRTRYKTGNRSAAARMAYITGQSQQQLEYTQAPEREDLVHTATRNLPSWATNATQYFQAAERYERVNGVAFEEMKITLPVELTLEQNKDLAERLVDAIAGDRLPCTYALHNPPTLDGLREQPHIHLLISARQIDDFTRTAAQHFRRYNTVHPEHGGAQKDPDMNVYHATRLHRLLISDVINVSLERYGHAARVHPESLKSRGIDREPEPKLLPSASRQYREDGTISTTMREVFKSRQGRMPQRGEELNNAYHYWEKRKDFLGITRTMSTDEKLAHILLKRHGAIERVPARYRSLVQQPAPARQPARIIDLAQRLQQLGRGENLSAGGKRLRIQLHEERERGMGW